MKKVILILVMLISLVGCTSQENNMDKKIIAVAIGPIYDYTKEIAGDNFTVVQLIPSGSSPEDYQLSVNEMVSLSDSILYFSFGLPAETNNFLDNVSSDTKVVNLVTEVSKNSTLLNIGDSIDPHIWMSLSNMKLIVESISENIIELDPDNKITYEQNASNIIERLTALEFDVKSDFSSVTNNKIIVYHPSMGYFSNEWNLQMTEIEEEGKEASASKIASVINFAKENDINTIFYQKEIPYKEVETIANQIGSNTVAINPLSTDYESNYIKIVKEVVESLK